MTKLSAPPRPAPAPAQPPSKAAAAARQPIRARTTKREKVPAQPPVRGVQVVPQPQPTRRPAPVPAKRLHATVQPLPRLSVLKIPPILLEGDQPPAPPLAQPSAPPAEPPAPQPVPVPEASAAVPLPPSRPAPLLHLFAQDSYWIHAYWQISESDQRQLQACSSSGRLVLRVFKTAHQGDPVQALDLDPLASDWFVKVDEAGATYLTDLGCYNRAGEWICAAVSNATSTPRDTMAPEGEVRFATISPEGSLVPSQPMPASAAPSSGPRPDGSPEGGLPPGEAGTQAQAKAMAEVLWACQCSRRAAGSAEIAELVRRGAPEARGPAQPGEAAVSLLAPQGPVSISSPAGPPAEFPPTRPFWFNINADLVIYGATEPDATVTMGGRPIPLRPDGTFSCRFTLPDGIFSLVAEAISADGADRRLAELCFSRLTRYAGEVGEHPPEAGLSPPRVEALE